MNHCCNCPCSKREAEKNYLKEHILQEMEQELQEKHDFLVCFARVIVKNSHGGYVRPDILEMAQQKRSIEH